VAVPAGHHTIVLRYDDPFVRYGLAGSAAALAIVIGAALALMVRRKRALPTGPPP